MTEVTPDSLIPYDEIVQEALRAVVGRVLGEIVRSGSELPGNHHFYITFKTHAQGVSIPDHLRERFPDEMTIVCLLYTSPSPRDQRGSRMPSSA